MNMRIHLSNPLRKQLLERLHTALRLGERRLVKRILALMDLVDGHTPAQTAERLELSERTVWDYLTSFLLRGLASLSYKRSSGRAPKLSKRQRKELGELLDAGPEAAGYDCGCWTTALIQELIVRRFGVEYNTRYVAELLKNLGYSYQRARFVSDHLGDVAQAQKQWLEETWPAILRLAAERQALILFGDEASFAQWGSLSYTWSRRGVQPTVKTSGQRRAYKTLGAIEFFSGTFFYHPLLQGRFTSETYTAFLTGVLDQTAQHLILIQDGARYHTSKAMQEFFARHAQRLTVFQLPSYSPDFNPIEYLWRNLKKQATHLRYFPTFQDLVRKVDEKLQLLANLPDAIKNLMGKYCQSLGAEVI